MLTKLEIFRIRIATHGQVHSGWGDREYYGSGLKKSIQVGEQINEHLGYLVFAQAPRYKVYGYGGICPITWDIMRQIERPVSRRVREDMKRGIDAD